MPANRVATRGCGAIVFLLLTAGTAAAEDMIAALDVGGGLTKTQYRYQGEDTDFAGAGLDVRGAYGRWFGRFGGGLGLGALLVPSLDSEWISGTKPESMSVVHAGGFAFLRVSETTPIVIGGRLELAYARLSGTSAIIADGPSTTGLLTSSGGGLFGLRASYEPVVATHAALQIGLEAFGGVLGKPGSSLTRLVPFGAMATVGVGWR